MNFISAFEVIGPNMVGPSSSHTAGAVSIGKMARKLFKEKVTEVTFTLYGSFARTYKGHGTDRALLGGVLGFATDDLRIRDAFSWAEKMGVKYQYIADKEFVPDHPNTVDIRMTGENGTKMQVQGQSIGGGKIKITQINYFPKHVCSPIQYPAEYRDYRDHQFFLLSILVGMGTGNSDWNLVCPLEKKGVGRAETADSTESF